MSNSLYRAFIAISLFIFCGACSNVLDKDPLGRLDADSFFKTTDDALQVVNMAYRPLLFSNANNNFYWAFGTLASEEAIVGGDGSRPGLVEIDALTHTPATQEFNDFWKLSYAGIVQANTVISKIKLLPDDSPLKARITGEALFLRAWYHFVLAQVFGDIPLILELQDPDEVRIPRTQRDVVLLQVAEDCRIAADLLPVAYTASDLGRATKGAALALRAKAFLYLESWNQTLDAIAEIKSIGIYALQEDYRNNLYDSTQNNSESVWEIQHANLELGVGNNLNQYWASNKIPDGYGFAEVTAAFANAFEPGDPRLRFTVARHNEEYFGYVYKASFSSTGMSPRKFLQHVNAVSQKSDGAVNYPAIRYAEVLLWEAEALAELGRTAEALVPLEEVRARARGQAANPETTLPEITTTDKNELIDLIRHERLVELGFELHRFFDLVRWGIADTVLPGFVKGKHEYFPIPQTELDLNPMLTQNPGY